METAGCGDQVEVGLSGGGGDGADGGGIASTQQQMDRPADDGQGGSHNTSNQDGGNEVSTTASSSSDDGEIHSNNQQVGGGTNIQPGKLSEDHSPNKGSELNFLPFGSRCQDAQVKRLDWFLDLRVFETFVGTNHT